MISAYQSFVSAVAKVLQVAIILLFAILFMDVIWGVFSRYVLGSQSRWTEEVAINLLIWVSLLGAAITYRDRGHLGFDYIIRKLHPDAQRLTVVITELVCIGFFIIVLLYGGGSLMLRSLANGQLTPALGWQVGYFYSVIPISGACFLLFAIEHLLDSSSPISDHHDD